MENETNQTVAAAPQLEQRAILPSPFSILGQTFAFYRSHLDILLAVSAVPFVVALAVVFGKSNIPGPLFIALSILSPIVSFTAYIALIAVVANNGSPLGGMQGSYKTALKLFFPFLWVNILCALVTWGGAILLIIPGIYLSILISLGVFVLVVEDKRGISALAQSWHYVRGFWWAVVGRILFLGLIVLGSAVIVSLIVTAGGSESIGQALTGMAEHTQTPTKVGTVILNIFNTFIILPINIIYSYILYQSLRNAKSQPSSPEQEKGVKNKLWTFVGLGVLAIVVFAAAAIYVASSVAQALNYYK